DERGLDGHSVAAVVIGGEDEDVADVINRFALPGISTSGNHRIETSIDGLCRTIWITRPLELDMTVEIRVRPVYDQLGCPAPSPSSIAHSVLAYASEAETRPRNGDTLSPYYFRSFIE